MTDEQGYLDEALGATEAPPEPQRAPTPPAVHEGGFGPMIEKTRKELLKLEDKMDNHRTTGAYIVRTDSGREEFDYMAHQEDMMRIQRLNRELDDLRRRQDDHLRLMESRKTQAAEMARTIFNREMQRMPKDMHRPAAEQFARIFTTLPDNEWAKSMYADRSVLEQAIMQLIDTAIGRVRRASWSGAPQSDSDADVAPKQEAPEDDVDDFTNNVLYAFQERRKQSMTIAERRRAEAAAATAAAANQGGAQR